tara:strand:+ start:541 stop:1014 length:474 start_codon:yes stop_codon:yes gene_type:complete
MTEAAFEEASHGVVARSSPTKWALPIAVLEDGMVGDVLGLLPGTIRSVHGMLWPADYERVNDTRLVFENTELWIVPLRGELEFGFEDDETAIAETGCALAIDTGVHHTQRNRSEVPALYLSVELEPTNPLFEDQNGMSSSSNSGLAGVSEELTEEED